MARDKKIKPKKPKVRVPKCDICGNPEEHPVANEYRGRIEWICYRCYKLKKGA